MMSSSLKRTALLIRCSPEEAEKIRAAARKERRTLSGYIVNAVMSRIETREKWLRDMDQRVRAER